MMSSHEQLIDELTSELKPVRRVSLGIVRLLVIAASIASAVMLAMLYGVRPDFLAGEPHPIALVCLLVILVAGVAATAIGTAMARPAVGAARVGWQWSVAPVAVLPVAALITWLNGRPISGAGILDGGVSCLGLGMLAAMCSIVVLAWWLKRGAPTSAARASWLIGLAGGCLGAAAVSLVCQSDSITHIGTWHAAIIALSATVSRFAIAPLLRW
jgi:hypothetical protein